ncbi:hypothetical protein [Dysosmobacter sp.]
MSDDQYKTDIVKRLRGYCELVRKINILQFQLANPPQISEEEMMSAMAYAHGMGGTQAPGHISDKTAYIALHYREKAAAINEESVSIISSRLTRMEREKNELGQYRVIVI